MAIVFSSGSTMEELSMFQEEVMGIENGFAACLDLACRASFAIAEGRQTLKTQSKRTDKEDLSR